MKALLINGARSLGNLYDHQVKRTTANDQGWGLVNLPNSIPATLKTNSGPTVFFDQIITNALATGQSQTWNVYVRLIRMRRCASRWSGRIRRAIPLPA